LVPGEELGHEYNHDHSSLDRPSPWQLVLIAAFAIGEGVPNPLHGSIPENLLTAAFLAMIVAQIAAWKWEGIGGLLIVGSFGLFAIVNHGVPLNVVFGPWLLTGLLYWACWVLGRRRAGATG
jgi:hypothetical protein